MSAGLVATGHERVTDTAASLLDAGGNAFDAVIGAGFAAGVAEPMLTSLGGGGFLLARTAEGRARLFDFFADTPGRGKSAAALEPHFVPVTVHFPGSDQIFNIGLGSVAVPGAIAGFLHVHERLGRLPLDEVVAPAVTLAREGVALNGHQAYALELLEPICDLTAAGRVLYAPQGRMPREGESLANPDLADWLEALPGDRARSFYEGEIAARIVADMREGGGLLTRADLAGYRVLERTPLEVRYRDRRLLTNPPPSFGGSLVALTLRLLDAQGPMPEWGSPEHLVRLAATMVEVDAMRESGSDADTALAAPLARLRRASGGTTHLSVADADGNAASLTLSNGEGSGYIAPGTGIQLNNMLGEDDLHPEGFHASAPGQRVASMMSPSMVLRDDAVEWILGTGGSKRIRTTLVQVVSALVDHGMHLADAVEAPRLHWDGACIQIEPGFPEAAVDALARSWPVNRWEAANLYFGGAHAVALAGAACGDPRRGGTGRVLPPPAGRAR